MTSYKLPADTHIGYAHFNVRDMARALRFYVEQAGLRQIKQDGATVTLSADGHTPIVLLTEHRDFKAKPPRSTGLYHVAIRLPSRTALANLFRRLIAQNVPFGGFSDHAVSEALYLPDPDGNGLELYRDRPRSEWRIQPDGQVAMTTEPLDLDDLLREADDKGWAGIDPGTDIGHVHLHVSDLGRAKAFYCDLLGMDLVADWSAHGAYFVSAGGYHHHLGLNIWAGRTPPPADAVGLQVFSLHVPAAGYAALLENLRSAGVPVSEQADGHLTQDQDGNRILLVQDK